MSQRHSAIRALARLSGGRPAPSEVEALALRWRDIRHYDRLDYGRLEGLLMNVLEFTVLVAVGSLAAGFLGALTGLGGGVVLVPLLTLFFKVDIRYAIGASLVSVIATSSGAAAAYVKEGFSNIRIGMFLEIATTSGALLGAFLAAVIPVNALAVIFGFTLLYSAFLSRKTRTLAQRSLPPDPLSTKLKMNGDFPDTSGMRHYNVYRVPAGFPVILGSRAIARLLG